jgi:hypothetical protein
MSHFSRQLRSDHTNNGLTPRMSGTSGGSNILRGGKRTYDCKTLVGNFVEEAFRPNAIKTSWGGGAMYETTTTSQMQSGAGVRVQTFGAGLKRGEDPRYDYHQIVGADKTRGATTWVSLTQSVHNHTAKVLLAGRGMDVVLLTLTGYLIHLNSRLSLLRRAR